MSTSHLRKTSLLLFFLFCVLSFIKEFYQLPQRAMFEYDQEYLAWAAKAIIVDRKTPLIGASTSVGNMFIGPLYNYLSALFFWLFHMDPIAVNLLTALWNPFTLGVTFLLVRDLFDLRIASLTSLLLLGSFSFNYFALNPPLTHGLPIISLFILWALIRLNQGKKYLLFIAFMVGLSFHLHFTSLVLFVLSVLFTLIALKRYSYGTIIQALSIVFAFLSPLLLFDIRNNNLISKNLYQFIIGQSTNHALSPQHYLLFFQTIFGEFAYLLFYRQFTAISQLIAIGVIVSFVFIFPNLPKQKHHPAFMIFLWLAAFVGLFSFYRGLVLPYYLLPIEIPFFILFAICLSILQVKGKNLLVAIFFVIYFISNIYQWINFESPMGLAHKLRAMEYIKMHSQNQPIYLSYTIEPGLDGGFRYLEWYLKLQNKNDQSLPIYTLVVPSYWIKTQLDFRSGDIGVIHPRKKTNVWAENSSL